MTYSFYKLYPMGNSTVLIDNLKGEITRSEYHELARTVMSENYLSCEQVGYICPSPDPMAEYQLEMMGGELCVNALRCLGYWVNSKEGKNDFLLTSLGSKEQFKIHVGTEHPQVHLSFRMAIQHHILSKTLSLVQLDGISHFVEEFPDIELSPDLIMSRLNAVCLQHADMLKGVEAVGYIPYQKNGEIRITPLVHVLETGTKVFETACGSGTVAVGIHEFYCGSQQKKYEIRQASGALFKVEINEASKGIYDISIASDVQLLIEGTLQISELI